MDVFSLTIKIAPSSSDKNFDSFGLIKILGVMKIGHG